MLYVYAICINSVTSERDSKISTEKKQYFLMPVMLLRIDHCKKLVIYLGYSLPIKTGNYSRLFEAYIKR